MKLKNSAKIIQNSQSDQGGGRRTIAPPPEYATDTYAKVELCDHQVGLSVVRSVCLSVMLSVSRITAKVISRFH